MGVSCSRPSTASSSTPDRRPPPTTPRASRCASPASPRWAGPETRYLESMYRIDTSPRYVPACEVATSRMAARGRQGVCAVRGGPAGRITAGRVSARSRMRRSLSGMAPRRCVVDYALARRATLASVFAGHTTVADVCDAHPYLLRAAKFHGEATDTRCPICRRAKLTHVTYVYGDELGRYEGRVKQACELAEMAAEYGEFRAYVVEVCQSCGWNHLASSYVLGTGEPRSRRGRSGPETASKTS